MKNKAFALSHHYEPGFFIDIPEVLPENETQETLNSKKRSSPEINVIDEVDSTFTCTKKCCAEPEVDLSNQLNTIQIIPNESSTNDESIEQLSTIFPDADPEFLLTTLLETGSVELVVEKACQMKEYPKRGTLKTMAKELPTPSTQSLSSSRPLQTTNTNADKKKYVTVCLLQLTSDFPWIPADFISKVMDQNNCKYFESHVCLDKIMQKCQNGFRKNVRPTNDSELPFSFLETKRTEQSIVKKENMDIMLLENEICAVSMGFTSRKDAIEFGVIQEAVLKVVDVEDEDELDCGCCFVSYPLSNLTNCMDGHLFCLDCARQAAEILIGM
ncbi:hypothetical protein HK096_001694, partial [Nowakowskiella sp. JEL0078]